jgi:uncharacterized protein
MMQITRFADRADGPAERLAGFMSHLRLNGIPAGVMESATALRALAEVDVAKIGEVRLALKAICATDAEHNARFDELFDAYWLNTGRSRTQVRVNETRRNFEQQRFNWTNLFGEGAADEAGEADTPDDDAEGESAGSGTGRLVASKVSTIEKTDLRRLMTPDQLAEAERIAEAIARSFADRRSRRRKMAQRGTLLNMRRILRHSVSRGGEPIDLFYRRRPDRPVRIVAMLDVSGSMAVYARVFLSFLKGLVAADRTTDAYLFHTRLVRISDALRDGDTLRAVNRLSLLSQGFGGGTKIGANLMRFNTQYAAQTVNGRSVIIIISDGYDTDPPQIVAQALARLKRRGARIVWLNPLKGWKGYEPVARGMAAALPYLDLFAAAGTLKDLRALEPALGRI